MQNDWYMAGIQSVFAVRIALVVIIIINIKLLVLRLCLLPLGSSLEHSSPYPTSPGSLPHTGLGAPGSGSPGTALSSHGISGY